MNQRETIMYAALERKLEHCRINGLRWVQFDRDEAAALLSEVAGLPEDDTAAPPLGRRGQTEPERWLRESRAVALQRAAAADARLAQIAQLLDAAQESGDDRFWTDRVEDALRVARCEEQA